MFSVKVLLVTGFLFFALVEGISVQCCSSICTRSLAQDVVRAGLAYTDSVGTCFTLNGSSRVMCLFLHSMTVLKSLPSTRADRLGCMLQVIQLGVYAFCALCALVAVRRHFRDHG